MSPPKPNLPELSESSPETRAPSRKEQLMHALQEVQGMQLAFIGLHNGLVQALAGGGMEEPAALARKTNTDKGYVLRWCEAAYAFGLLEEEGGAFMLSDEGRAYLPDQPGTLMPLAVHSLLGGHMTLRAAELTRTGERPGEVVLGEQAAILPWFGPMLAANFGPLFEQHILPGVPVFEQADRKGGLAVDLGCGNGWYLRKLAQRMPGLRGLGIDGIGENIRQAEKLAQEEKLDHRLTFQEGDIYTFSLPEPADLIAMNRALHHVWDDKERVFKILADHLKPGGAAVIWEPNWPVELAALRQPGKRGMAVQNLAEHIQGNHFLQPDEICQQMEKAGLKAHVFLFMNGNEQVVVGRK
ncbi:MAG: methyltransferase domain-containing protein [Deltaproteobacteria bacterium]|nr:methyltransferase domain-containing protein [Deltaproteobacteria bacterium]